MSQLPAPTMTQRERLEKWWASLDAVRREHAHVCVDTNTPDGPFLEGLRGADIGLADVGWAAHSSSRTHIPTAIQKFVRAQRDGDGLA
jgi:hypothetical protein